MEKHPDLVKIITSAGLLDSVRPREATRATRDAVFYKLDTYTRKFESNGEGVLEELQRYSLQIYLQHE
jgi:hypothetical protein